MSKVARVWGLPLAPLTRGEAAEAVFRLIEAGRPSYFITANAHYAMLTAEHPELGPINERAAFLLADGAPLVWASKRGPTPLPERVAGSDLIFDLCELAAARGKSIYFLGGGDGVAEEAARKLRGRYPNLKIVGTVAPPPGDLAGEGCDRLIAEIRAAKPDLLMVALGQPKGEFWLAKHLRGARRPGLRTGRGDARLRRRSGAAGPQVLPEDRDGMGLPDLHRPGPAGPPLRQECPVPAGQRRLGAVRRATTSPGSADGRQPADRRGRGGLEMPDAVNRQPGAGNGPGDGLVARRCVPRGGSNDGH